MHGGSIAVVERRQAGVVVGNPKRAVGRIGDAPGVLQIGIGRLSLANDIRDEIGLDVSSIVVGEDTSRAEQQQSGRGQCHVSHYQFLLFTQDVSTLDTTIAVILFECNNRVEDNSFVFAGSPFVITWKMPTLFPATTLPLACTSGPEIDSVRVEPGTSCAFQGRLWRRSACAPDVSYSPCLPRSVSLR